MRELIKKVKDWKYEDVITGLTCNYVKYIEERKEINDNKGKALKCGINLFFLSLSFIIAGILFFMFNI